MPSETAPSLFEADRCFEQFALEMAAQTCANENANLDRAKCSALGRGRGRGNAKARDARKGRCDSQTDSPIRCYGTCSLAADSSSKAAIDTVRKRLWDATKPEKGGLLIGSEKTGWRLTKAGFVFARRYIRAGPVAQATPRASQSESVARTRELRRMSNEDAARKFRSGEQDSITKSDAEHFFRIDDYVTGKSRAAKLERFRIMAANNRELTHTIDFLAKLLEGHKCLR
jgi:hypothetical protein